MDDRSLLIRLHSLGDVVLASGLAASMARVQETAFLTREEYLPVIRRIPGNILAIPYPGTLSGLRKLAGGYGEIIDLQNNLTTRLALFMIKRKSFSFSRRKRRAVLAGGEERLQWRARQYYDLWGGPGDPAPVLERRAFPPPGRTTVGIVAGGRWPMKTIPRGVIAEVARLFCDISGGQVLILGGPSDVETADWIVGECGYRRVVSAAGEGDLEALIERVETLDLLISPDSGPAHLGIALGVPTQVVFTSTSPALGFYREDLPGAFSTTGVPCRPCHRHGARECRAGDMACRNELVPREIFEEALCLMP